MAGEEGVFIATSIFSIGALGLFIYLHHKADEMWRDVWLFCSFNVLAYDLAFLRVGYQNYLVQNALATTTENILVDIVWLIYALVGLIMFKMLLRFLKYLYAVVRGLSKDEQEDEINKSGI